MEKEKVESNSYYQYLEMLCKEKDKEIEKLRKKVEMLEHKVSLLSKEANMDFLTELPNRRSFLRGLKDFLKGVKEYNYPFSIIIFDLDNFKKINDTYGHIAGDKVLMEVGWILKRHLRANSVPGRIGGEEFAILLPGVKLKDAVSIAERIRKILEESPIRYNNNIIKITASFGVTQASKNDSVTSILERADKLLYKAKKGGKNQVAFG